MSVDGYHASRLVFDPRRDTLWRALWRYRFSAMVTPTDCVLDLGAGYCNFINAASAARRVAVDAWSGFANFAAPGVETFVAPVTELGFLKDSTVDFAFASNLFEHLTRVEFTATLAALHRKLSPRGTLTLVQPNYRYAYREYFDDFDHKSVFSHVSMPDFLASQNFEVFCVEPRFMPLTVKGGLPVHPLFHPHVAGVTVQAFGQADADPRPTRAVAVSGAGRLSLCILGALLVTQRARCWA